MNIKENLVNFALVGLVVFGMLSFIVVIQNDNNAPEKIGENAIINQTYNSLYQNLTNAETSANEQNSVFGNVTPTESYGEVQIDSVVSPTRILKNIVLGIYNILIKLPSSLLGISPIVQAVISAIIIFSLIVCVWILWKGGLA